MADLRLRVLLAAVDKATGPLRKIRGGGQKTAKALAGLKRQADDISQFRKLSASSSELGDKLNAARARVANLSRTMRSAEKPTRAMQREFNSAVGAARKLSQAHAAQRERLHRLRQSLSIAGIETGKLSSHERRLRTEIAQTTRILDQQRRATERLATARNRMQRMHGAGMTTAAHGAGAMYMGRRALTAAAGTLAPGLGFETTMSRVQSLARLEKDSDAMRALRADARAKGRSTLFSSTEVGEGQAFLAMAGFDPESIIASTQAMLDTALAGNLDLARAADITSNISSAFGIDSRDADAMNRLADQLVTGFTTSNTTLEDLGETMKYFAPIAKAGGVDTATSIAMAGMLGNVGIQGSMAGTSLREMTSRMASLPASARKSLDKLGVSTMDERGNMRNIVELIADIDAAFQREQLGSGERLAALNDIFGKRAMSGMADLSERMGSGEFQKYVDIVRGSDGNASSVAAIMADNVKGDLDQLLSAAKDVSIGLFEEMAPTLRELSQRITEMLRGLGQWVADNPRLARTLGLVAGGAAVLLTTLGGLALLLGTLLMPLAGLHYGVTVLATKVGPLLQVFGALGKSASLLTALLGGISLPLLAIGALVAVVAGLVWKYWGPISAFLSGVWDGFSTAMAPVMEQLRAALAPLAPLWDALAGGTRAAWSWIKRLLGPFQATSEQLEGATGAGRRFGEMLAGLISAALSRIGGVFKYLGGLWDTIAGVFTGDWSRIRNGLTSQLEGINAIFGGLPAKFLRLGAELTRRLAKGIASGAAYVLAPFVALWQSITQYAGGIWDTIAGIFTGDWSRIRKGITSQLEGINAIFSGLPAKFLQFGVDMIKGLISGISSMAGALRNAVTGAVSGAVDRFKSFLGIRSPSRLFAQFGGFTMQGFAGGLEREQERPVAALQAMGSRLARIGGGIALGATVPAAAFAGSIADAASGIRVDNRPPIAAGAPAPVDGGLHIGAIHIHATPGMDAQAVAAAVRRELELLERERAARRRSRFSDYD